MKMNCLNRSVIEVLNSEMKTFKTLVYFLRHLFELASGAQFNKHPIILVKKGLNS